LDSLDITRVEGLGMGQSQAEGTYYATEPNRYATEEKPAVSVKVKVSNPYVVTDDFGLVGLRNGILNENRNEFDQNDFENFDIPDGELSVDDLSDSGIAKLSKMTTDALRKEGYDSIYFPASDIQEGELVVFNKPKEKIGSPAYSKNKKSEGDTDTRTLGDGTKIKGTYKIVSSNDVLASHNEETFSQTPGFPTNPNGKTANDRDYKTDTQAQAQVQSIATTLDERAIDQTPVVTTDGIVLDGNNRTMSRKLASKLGTDKEYLDGLKRKLKRYGLPENALDGITNPMLVFELETPLPYTTETFALFNKQEKKEKGPIERAVEISKRASDRFKNILAQIYEEAEKPSEVSSDPKKITKIKALLQEEGILGSNEFPRYFNEDNTATKEGVSFLETLVLGAALDENTIRTLDNPGMGNVKNIILKSIIPLIRNSALGNDSLIPDIIEGIDYLSKAKSAKMSPVDMASQLSLGFSGVKPPSPEALMIALTLEGGFKDFLKNYNNSVGTTDIFRGEQTKGVIIEDNLKTKIKNYEQVRQNLRLSDSGTKGEVQEGIGGRKSEKGTAQTPLGKAEVTPPAPAAPDTNPEGEGTKPAPKGPETKGGEGDFTAKGGNKVVNEKGEPLVLYHGTDKKFEKFSDEGLGYFFTTDKGTAEGYMKKYGSKDGYLKSVNVKISEPIIIDAKGKKWDDIEVETNQMTPQKVKLTTSQILQTVRGLRSPDIFTNLSFTNKKADGLIIKNVIDPLGGIGKPIDLYIPFETKQISELKSLAPTTQPSFTSKQEGNASTEFDGIKKPSKIKTKSFDNKYGNGAFERMQNITQNFEDIMDNLSDKIKQDCI
jgi:hypothetical protein